MWFTWRHSCHCCHYRHYHLSLLYFDLIWDTWESHVLYCFTQVWKSFRLPMDGISQRENLLDWIGLFLMPFLFFITLFYPPGYLSLYISRVVWCPPLIPPISVICLFDLCNIILLYIIFSPLEFISSSLYPSGTFPSLCPLPCSCSPF